MEKTHHHVECVFWVVVVGSGGVDWRLAGVFSMLFV